MSFKARVKPGNSVWMEDAKLKNLIVCQPQNRNRSELLRITERLHAKLFPGSTRFLAVSSCARPLSWPGPTAMCLVGILYSVTWARDNAHYIMQLTFWSSYPTKQTFTPGQCRPWCMHMDDIWFRSPVEIGAMLYFNSQICYVQVSN